MSVARSSFLFTLGTLLSRITGLIRDSVLSGVFGAGTSIEAFFIANRIPNLFRDMLAEGALGSSFTKIYTTLEVQDKAKAQTLLCDAFRFGFWFLIAVSIFGALSAPFFVDGLTLFSGESGRPPEFYRESVFLTRLLFPFLGFAILAALAGGVLQTRGDFFLAAVSSSGLNLGYIIGSLVFAQLLVANAPEWIDQEYADRRILGLAIGVVLGGAFHFLIQFAKIYRTLIRVYGWTFSPVLLSVDLKRVFVLMAPAAIASSAGSLNILVSSNFATSLETGAVTWLNFAFRLLQLPIGVFAVAVGSVALPSLTRAVARAGNRVDHHVSKELGDSCEFINWLMVPCLAFLLVASLPTVKLLFEHGKFDAYSAKATADALVCYSFGVVGYGLIKVFTSFYYAVERTSYAMKVSLAMVGLNALSNMLLVKELGHVGLAATSSITLSGNALLLFLGLRSDGVKFDFRRSLKSYRWLFAAFVLCIPLEYFVLGGVSDFAAAYQLSMKLDALLGVLAVGTVVVAVFGSFALVKLGIGPKAGLKKLASLRRSNRR